MNDFALGTVIAVRHLVLEASGDQTITVLMGAPQEVTKSDATDFACPIQIIGLGDEKVRVAWGVDGFQAVQLALQLIGVELYVKLNPKCGHGLRWNGSVDLSFPLPESVREFAPQDRLE